MGVPRETTDLIETTAVRFRTGKKAQCYVVPVYKIPQNGAGTLHSLGAFSFVFFLLELRSTALAITK